MGRLRIQLLSHESPSTRETAARLLHALLRGVESRFEAVKA